MPAAAHLPQTLGYFNQPRPPLSRLPVPIKFDRIVNRAEYNEVIARLYKELKVRAVTVEVLGRRRYRVTSHLPLLSTYDLLWSDTTHASTARASVTPPCCCAAHTTHHDTSGTGALAHAR